MTKPIEKNGAAKRVPKPATKPKARTGIAVSLGVLQMIRQYRNTLVKTTGGRVSLTSAVREAMKKAIA